MSAASLSRRASPKIMNELLIIQSEVGTVQNQVDKHSKVSGQSYNEGWSAVHNRVEEFAHLLTGTIVTARIVKGKM